MKLIKNIASRIRSIHHGYCSLIADLRRYAEITSTIKEEEGGEYTLRDGEGKEWTVLAIVEFRRKTYIAFTDFSKSKERTILHMGHLRRSGRLGPIGDDQIKRLLEEKAWEQAKRIAWWEAYTAPDKEEEEEKETEGTPGFDSDALVEDDPQLIADEGVVIEHLLAEAKEIVESWNLKQ